MSDQYNRQQFYRDTPREYGKRFREDDTSDYSENFDVDQPVSRRPVQNYYPEGQQYSQRGRMYPQNYGDDYDRGAYNSRAYDNGRDRRANDTRAYDDRYSQYNDSRDYYYDQRNNRGYDDRARAPKKRTSGAIIAVRVIAVILLIVGLGIVGFKLYSYYTDSKGHNELKALSADFNQLYGMNSDFYGWLKVDDTEIDYPVMYTPYDPEHYLHTDFDGDYSESGELFMDANCDPNGYHALIYGHHMFNGSMFGNLPKYEDIDYLNSHRTLRFDTMSERGEYEIFAVFYSQVYDDSEDVFKYYYYANLDDEWTYNNYVANVKALSIYDTGVTPAYGEKIVTLSTCNYHTDDGRFVVCARKIS